MDIKVKIEKSGLNSNFQKEGIGWKYLAQPLDKKCLISWKITQVIDIKLDKVTWWMVNIIDILYFQGSYLSLRPKCSSLYEILKPQTIADLIMFNPYLIQQFVGLILLLYYVYNPFSEKANPLTWYT